jgi:hypothetical protein
VLLEGDDATALTHFALMWSDLLVQYFKRH